MKKLMSIFLVLAFAFSSSLGTLASASEVEYKVKNIERLVKQTDYEKSAFGEVSDETIAELEKALNDLGIAKKGSYSGTHYITEENIPSGFGFRYGQPHDLGRGWSYRVDKPEGNGKPHAHVYKGKVEVGTESCDGTPSHGRDFSKVPKKIRDKVRNSKDYQKGKKDIENYKRAKVEIQNRGLNLNVNSDLLIAAGIIVAFVGVAYFAPYYIPGFLSLI